MTITDLYLACKNLDTDNIFHIYRRNFKFGDIYSIKDEYFGSYNYNDIPDSVAETNLYEFEMMPDGSVKVYIEA